MVRTRALRKVVFGCVQCLLEGRLDLRGACQQGIQACQYLYLRMGFCKDGLNIQGSLMGPAGHMPYFQLYFECIKLDFYMFDHRCDVYDGSKMLCTGIRPRPFGS
jgi:hypothetical protein